MKNGAVPAHREENTAPAVPQESLGDAPPGGQEPDWKVAFDGAIKQRNEWMNRAQNLELDIYLMQEKLNAATKSD